MKKFIIPTWIVAWSIPIRMRTRIRPASTQSLGDEKLGRQPNPEYGQCAYDPV